MAKFGDKSHKIKPILVRAFDAADSWKQFILNLEKNEKQGLLGSMRGSMRSITKKQSTMAEIARQDSIKKLIIVNSQVDIESPLL